MPRQQTELPKKVRIIGGVWRSRLLDVIDLPDLRPTTDRIRETLFNWLGQDLARLRCLDLFAGTGVLGFEAASRGAASVQLVEKNKKAYLGLTHNFAALQSSPVTGVVQIAQQDGLEFSTQKSTVSRIGAAVVELSPRRIQPARSRPKFPQRNAAKNPDLDIQVWIFRLSLLRLRMVRQD